MHKQKIALLLSGGVDSSVALHLLKQQNITPDCFYIKIGPEEDKEWDCSSEEDVEMASAVSHKYGCPFQIIDLHKAYWDGVVSYTMDKVRNGLTPNPDVMCNKLIKFGAFEEKVGHEYDYIATGHYATTTLIDGKTWLSTSPDPVKDQTDFLAQIDFKQVSKALFPIGNMMKDEVRQIAEEAHLINAKRKDSQGICFLGRINYNDYIRRYLGENPGDVKNIDTGKVIGRHKGLWFHTIGQRHGLGFGGGPWYAIKKDTAQNTLYVSRGFDTSAMYKKEFPVKGFHFITDNPWGEAPKEIDITFKIRHTSDYHPAVLVIGEGDEMVVKSAHPIQGVAPGQFCVIYDAQHHLCIGSGEISI